MRHHRQHPLSSPACRNSAYQSPGRSHRIDCLAKGLRHCGGGGGDGASLPPFTPSNYLPPHNHPAARFFVKAAPALSREAPRVAVAVEAFPSSLHRTFVATAIHPLFSGA